MWFYAFFEWWGAVAATVLCIPTGVVFTACAPFVIGTVRRTPLGGDRAATVLLSLSGTTLAIVAVVLLDGAVRAVVALCGAALVLAAITVLELRHGR